MKLILLFPLGFLIFLDSLRISYLPKGGKKYINLQFLRSSNDLLSQLISLSI